MYGHHLKDAWDGKLATAQAVPQNTSAYGDEGSKQFNGTQGSVEVIVACNEAMSLAATKVLTVVLHDSADDSSFAEVDGVKFTETAPAGEAKTYAAGDIICRLPVPSNLRRYAKVYVTTDDAAASGKFDAWLDFQAR
jgi:hypothetical protein